jgi:endonuclease/exonuclease/phosphatase family metal-dependent hydrolase
MALRLISLNVEQDRHLQRQQAFFAEQQPDVLCLQEVLEADYLIWRETYGGFGAFAPMCRIANSRGGEDTLGIAIIARHPLTALKYSTYRGGGSPLAFYIMNQTPQTVLKRSVLIATLHPDAGPPVTIATTHFTWSPDGQASDDQRDDLNLLFDILGDHQHLVLCGDFNAPRGGEIFSAIAARYHDHVPQHFKTSIDAERHYAGDLEILVDGLFTTDHYVASDVRLVGGVSDHLAIVADVQAK